MKRIIVVSMGHILGISLVLFGQIYTYYRNYFFNYKNYFVFKFFAFRNRDVC